jgi:hypothetical protein
MSCIRQVAQDPPEPPGGVFAVRNPGGSTAKMSLVAISSHSPAIFAHGENATRWLQWLLRNLSIVSSSNLVGDSASYGEFNSFD